jgi:ribosome-binding protein aMBF1 (putative translation factor)
MIEGPSPVYRGLHLAYPPSVKDLSDVSLPADLLAEILHHVGSTVRDHRRGLGLSQAEAAGRAGLSEAGWSRLASGTADLRLSQLRAIQEVLDVDSLETFVGRFPSRRIMRRITA